MRIPRSTAIPTVIFAAVGIIIGSAYRLYSADTVFSAYTPTILLDAGHGSPDGGAVGASGTLEKDINLAITQKTGEVLEGRGFNVMYTRTEDNGIYDESSDTIRKMKVSDMNKRRKIMESSSADVFISIHMNSFGDPSANGLHIFYSADYEEIKPLAESIQQSIAEVTSANTHAVKTVSETLFLMKDPPLPCILAECGFLSNPDEEKKLNDEDYQSRIAWAIADSVCDFYE